MGGFVKNMRLVASACAIALVSIGAQVQAAEVPVEIVPPVLDQPKSLTGLQKAVFAGGCFWGVQGVFEHVRGVKKVYAGYSGGERNTARYEMVGTGQTGHAESVEVTYDPTQITYGQLLQVFFSVAHDPTQFNRQGPDTGAQYRSAIFYSDATQQSIARAYIEQLDKAKAFPKKIVTQVDSLKGFYKAEDYHQDFLIHNPRYPYIVYNDLPKIDNLKSLFPVIYQAIPVKVTDKVEVK